MEHVRRHPIQIVALRTGLTPHVIRMWERRYAAVNPERTPTNRRLYSDEDIARLRLLCRATQLGRSIGTVAGLSTGELRELVAEDEQSEKRGSARQDSADARERQPEAFVTAGLCAIEALDSKALEDTLDLAELALTQARCIESVVAPLIHEVGERWRSGTFRIGHEHLASGVFRTSLASMRLRLQVSADAPCLIAATMPGQLHELGIQMVASLAAVDGWKVTYLGPNLPAEEIAVAADVVGARVVALSFVYPPDSSQVHRELKRLRHLLPGGAAVIAGGRAVNAYAETLDQIGAKRITSLGAFRDELEAHRR